MNKQHIHVGMASKTLKEDKEEVMGDITVRLVVQDNKQFAGVVIGKDRKMVKIHGEPNETHDDVWERLSLCLKIWHLDCVKCQTPLSHTMLRSGQS